MGRYIFSVTGLLLLMILSGQAIGQVKAKINLVGIKQKSGEDIITLHSTRHFIFANNKYYLHIGTYECSRYEQSKVGTGGQIRFIIPSGTLGKIPDNSPVYLTYGRVSRDGTGLDIMSKDESVSCWSLGEYKASMIRK